MTQTKKAAFTTEYICTVLYVYTNLMANDTARHEVMRMENKYGKRTPWDSVYKLEALVKRFVASAHDMKILSWMLHSIADGMDSGDLASNDLSGNAIAGRYSSTVNWTIPQ